MIDVRKIPTINIETEAYLRQLLDASTRRVAIFALITTEGAVTQCSDQKALSIMEDVPLPGLIGIEFRWVDSNNQIETRYAEPYWDARDLNTFVGWGIAT